MIRLDKRLTAIAELVEGDIIADIGCDHGRLSVYLLQKNLVRHVYAIDISKPSLGKAKALADVCGLSDRLTPIHGDGLTALPVSVDTAVIAGVGGKKIQEILSDKQRRDNTKHFVLQPMRNTKELVEWLSVNDYTIISNICVLTAKKYDIIKARGK